MILFINACVRPESRTRRLAGRILERLGGDFVEVNLENEAVQPLSYKGLLHRDSLVAQGSFDDPVFRYANEFVAADTIVIAAPFWDLSFPSSLKCYFESVCVSGLTFVYLENGEIRSCCRAKRIIYVTTAGGPFSEKECGWRYVNTLSDTFFAIKDKILIKAENLDIKGADVEKILRQAEEEIDSIFE